MSKEHWQAAERKIKTRWAQHVDPATPLAEYPRPQLVRERWLNLNGLWDYAVVPLDQELVKEFEGKILVPFAIESALSGVMKPLLPDQRLWYRRSFTIPEDWHGQRVMLNFGAVDWETTVWCNQVKVGSHQGGFDPFHFELTDCLKIDGENELLVAVSDPSNEGLQERGKQTLKPGFVFYTAVSGIWQTVWLEPLPETSIDRLYLTPDIDHESLKIQIDCSRDCSGLTLLAEAKKGTEVIALKTNPAGQALDLPVVSPHLWSPDDPFLYDLEISLWQGKTCLDRVTSYFGMRKISLERDQQGVQRICLNNKFVFQYGPLDQGYWPDGLYTAPTDEALIFDIQFCKNLGLNMIRKHIKVEPARWYYHCDRLGMLVWQDMPSGGIVPKTAVLAMGFILNLRLRDDRGYHRFGREEPTVRERFRNELKAMVDALYHFPCIVIWVPFNESWGQFNARTIGRWLKTYDTTRLVDAASGWFDQGGGDIYSIHKYVGPAIPHPEKLRALALSEFGGIGLKIGGHLWQENKLFAYRMVKSESSLTAWYLKLMNKLIHLKKQGLSAAIYTELCDVEYEINGFLTYDREVMKMDVDEITKAHQRLIEH